MSQIFGCQSQTKDESQIPEKVENRGRNAPLNSRTNQIAGCEKSVTKSKRPGTAWPACWLMWFATVVVGCFHWPLAAQEFDEAQVQGWLAQLDAESLATRNQAEEKLVALGDELADWLDDSTVSLIYSSESAFRLQRIRARLFDQRVMAITTASTLSLKSMLTTTETGHSISKQTGNGVGFADPDFLSPELEGEFWSVIEGICRQTDWVIDYAGSNEFGMQLAPDRQSSGHPVNVASGVLRVEWIQDAGSSGQVRLRILWEPRLRIEALRIPMSGVELLDTEDQPWASFNKDAVYSIPPPGTRNHATLRLPVNATSQHPLQKLILPIDLYVIAPAGKAIFSDIVKGRPTGQTRQFGMASISLERVETTDNKLTVRLATRYDSDRMAQPLQSHFDWRRFCNANLINDDGRTIESAGVRQIRQEAFHYVIEYSFDLPDGDDQWHLDFRIPSGIVSVQERVELELPR